MMTPSRRSVSWKSWPRAGISWVRPTSPHTWQVTAAWPGWVQSGAVVCWGWPQRCSSMYWPLIQRPQ